MLQTRESLQGSTWVDLLLDAHVSGAPLAAPRGGGRSPAHGP